MFVQGDKPRGKQAQSGFHAPSQEKIPASNEGQGRAASEPVSEPADRVQRGSTMLPENGPSLDSENYRTVALWIEHSTPLPAAQNSGRRGWRG